MGRLRRSSMPRHIFLPALLAGFVIFLGPAAQADEEGRRTPDDLSFGKASSSGGDEEWLEMDNKARKLARAGDLSEAETLFNDALNRAQAKNHNEPGVLNSLLGLSLVKEKLGNGAESERLYELGMRTAESLWGPSDVRFAALMPDLAWLYHWHRKDDKAEVLFARVLKTYEANYGPDSAPVAAFLKDYQQYLEETSRIVEAQKVGHRLEHIKGKLDSQ